MKVIDPPQFGGVKILVESEGEDFIASAMPGEKPGFTSKAENQATNWNAENIAHHSLSLGIPAVSCEFGGFCPSEPQTFEQSLLQIPTALSVTAIAIERTFSQDGVTETEVARLLVKTYDIEKPAPLTVTIPFAGQELNTRQKVVVQVPGARFDEADGITVWLLRSNDINVRRSSLFFPGGDEPCPEQPFRNTFSVCGLEVVDAQTLAFSIDPFMDEDRAKDRNILGSYDIYVRWSPDNPVTEIFRTLESVALGVWTIGEASDSVEILEKGPKPVAVGAPDREIRVLAGYTLQTKPDAVLRLVAENDQGSSWRSEEVAVSQSAGRSGEQELVVKVPMAIPGPFVLRAFLLDLEGSELAVSVDVPYLDIDYVVASVEAVQVVQTSGQVIPLVADKSTFIRVLVGNEGDTRGDDYVQVSLTLVNAGSASPNVAKLALAVSLREFQSNTANFRIQGLYTADFRVPDEFTAAGETVARVTVNSIDGETALLPEDNAENNSEFPSFEFIPRRPLRVGYTGMCAIDFKGKRICPTGVDNADKFLRKIFPVPESGVDYFPLGIPEDLIGPGSEELSEARSIIRGFMFVANGIADAVAIWTPTGIGPVGDLSVEIQVLAELLLGGRAFSAFAGPNQERELAAGVLHAITRLNCDGNDPTAAESEFADAVGYDAQRGIVKNLRSFDEAGCTSGDGWIAPSEYGLLFLCDSDASACTSIAGLESERTRRQQAQGSLLVTGQVDQAGSGSLDPIYFHASGIPDPELNSSGQYCLELTGSSGALETACFDPVFGENGQASFLLILPNPDGFSRIALKSGSNVLATREASASAPTVRITAPLTGAMLDAANPATISWTSADGDGDALLHTVLYSNDGGASWLPVGVDVPDTTWTFNAARINGGENVLFRVLATDGFHTGEQTVGPVNVIQKPVIEVEASAGLGATVVGLPLQGVVPIRNAGSGPLTVQSVSSDNPAFVVRAALPSIVAAGATRDLSVEFSSPGVGTATAMLTIASDDPDQAAVTVQVAATARSAEDPVMQLGLDEPALRFGPTEQGLTSLSSFEVVNRGEPDLVLGLAIEGEGFSIVQPASALSTIRIEQSALVLATNEQQSIQVAFAPPKPGDFAGALALTTNDPLQPEVEIPLTGTGIEASTRPQVSAGGVVDAAQFQAVIARGGIGSIFGSELADDIVIAGDVPLPFELGGARVLVDGWEAPLFFVSPNQINFQVPFEADSPGEVGVVVTRNGEDSPIEPASMAEFAPGVFINPNTGEPIIQRHPDGALITAANPAKPGDVLIIFMTGIGGVSNPPATGAAATASPLARARVTPVVTVGGEGAQVFFAGLAPFFVGLGQVNIQLPESLLTTGATMPLVIDFEGSRNPPVNLPVVFEQ